MSNERGSVSRDAKIGKMARSWTSAKFGVDESPNPFAPIKDTTIPMNEANAYRAWVYERHGVNERT